MKYGHLEQFNVTLRTLSPVFIASGEHYNKKEYIFDPRRARIHFIDFPRFVAFLKSRSLLSHYEEFLLNPRLNDLRRFLQDKGIAEKDYSAFVLYSIDAGEAAQSEKFRNVMTFIKDASGRPYIPGSSLKGAIRTALGAYLIKKLDSSRLQGDIEQANINVKPRDYLSYESQNLERQLFYRLDIRDPRSGNKVPGSVNDFMQGIRISDSVPLDFTALTLTGKYDRRPDGSINTISIFRECLQPGVEARLVITLDLPIMAKAGLNFQDIEMALHKFADEYYANFERYFAESDEDAEISAKQGVDVILGGGAGYVSKTLTYNLFPQADQGLNLAARMMRKQFPPNHGHSRDVKTYKISPHMLKTTRYAGQFYQMGRCELIFD